MPDFDLDMPVQFLKGVGPVRAAHFAKLGVQTVGNLLEHFPFRYEHKPRSKPIGHLRLDETATVVGGIRRVSCSGGFRKSSVVAEVIDATGVCKVRWFNSAHLRDQLEVGQTIRLTGKVTADRRQAVFVNPEYRIIPHYADPMEGDQDRYEPIYPAIAELSSRIIATTVRQIVEPASAALVDFVPERLRCKRGLPLRRVAVARLHHPVTLDDVERARRRLAYDELLLMQVAVQRSRRQARQVHTAQRIRATDKIDERIRARLPFALTAAQDRAIAEIVRDLADDRPMARLLQGDVGAGKTAVAVYAALTAIANKRQVAMLAPTEILAQQTFARFERYLNGSRVRVGLLIGALTARRKAEMGDKAARGDLDLLVGTHALLEGGVRFQSLGLVIIDEQHRFGVAQRQSLRKKGDNPHFLVMTATPIPRTLAMTLYGDLDVTVIDELPPGRRPVETRLIPPAEQQSAWQLVRQRLEAGEQAFVVYPLVEESEALDLKAATSAVDALRSGALQGFNLGLLHGRLTADEKSRVIDDFRRGQIQALVSTTVIEVGVDVPSATVMVIEHAERYGLAQLHQLRGRIGRGNAASCCLLMTGRPDARSTERLNILCSTTDGFKIAEADLLIRGPGELVGTRQHGMPDFKAADLLRDLDLAEQARDDAAEIIRDNPDLDRPEHRPLYTALTRVHPYAATD